MAMTLALDPTLNASLRSLVIIDIAPVTESIEPQYVCNMVGPNQMYSLIARYAAYAQGYIDIEQARLKSRSEVDNRMKAYESVSRLASARADDESVIC